MQSAHHPPELTELIGIQARLEQWSLLFTVLHKLRYNIQLQATTVLQIVYVACVAFIQPLEDLIYPLWASVIKELLIHLHEQLR